MPKIKVSQPFNLRLGGKRREFPAGVHEISEAELKHWFVAACIKEGRAHVLVGDSAGTDSGVAPASVPPEAELRKMKRGDLEELAADLGLEAAGLPNKDAIVDLILESQSGDSPGRGDS